MDLKRLMHNVSYSDDYDLYASLNKKIYDISRVKKLLLDHDIYIIIGEGVIKIETIEKLEKTLDFTTLKSDFIPVRNEDELKALQNILSESQVQIDLNNEDADKKIKDEIARHTTNKEEQEKIFQIVKESEGLGVSDLKKNMTKVYEIIRVQGAVTEIFQANSKLKVNKNTFVAKRDYQNNSNINLNSTNTEV